MGLPQIKLPCQKQAPNDRADAVDCHPFACEPLDVRWREALHLDTCRMSMDYEELQGKERAVESEGVELRTCRESGGHGSALSILPSAYCPCMSLGDVQVDMLHALLGLCKALLLLASLATLQGVNESQVHQVQDSRSLGQANALEITTVGPRIEFLRDLVFLPQLQAVLNPLVVPGPRIRLSPSSLQGEGKLE